MADTRIDGQTAERADLSRQMSGIKREGMILNAGERALDAGVKAAEAASYLRFVPPVGLIFVLSGCTPTNKEMISLGSLVKQKNSFNSGSSSVWGGNVELSAGSYARDPGVSLMLSKKIDGKLEFIQQTGKEKAVAGNPVTIQFIKAVSARAYNRDKILAQAEFTPSDEPQKESLDIPEGTNKIVIMKTGTGGVDVKMSEVTVVPKQAK
jgi:hypothetical protein